MISSEHLCVLACSRLAEHLRRLKVPESDVGDLVHDVVLIALPKLGQFEPRRLGSEEEIDVDRALLAWLFAIAWRLLARRRARAWSRRVLCVASVDELEAAGKGSIDPEERMDRRRRLDLAHGVLAQLRPERAEVLVLHDVGGLTIPEIGRRLKLNPNTAKSRLSRAREDAQAVAQEMRLPHLSTALRPRAGRR